MMSDLVPPVTPHLPGVSSSSIIELTDEIIQDNLVRVKRGGVAEVRWTAMYETHFSVNGNWKVESV